MVYVVNSITRTLRILSYICRHKNGVRVSEIARELNSSPPAIYHYLKNMLEEGFIFKDQVSGRFRATYRIVDLATVVLENNEISELTHSFLSQLSIDTKSTVHLAIREGYLGVCVSKVGSSEAIPSITRVGMSFELYPTALGKAILSYISEQELQDYLYRTDFIPYTEKTITDKASLVEELTRIRERGYSVDNEEHRVGLRALGVPIFDYTQKVIGAISILLTADDGNQQIQHNLEKVREAAANISKKLGKRHLLEYETIAEKKSAISNFKYFFKKED